MRLMKLAAFVVFAIAPLCAQLAAPNSAGVAIGHLHVNVRDMDAQQRFWTTLGGTAVHNDKLQMMQFPGVFIVLRMQDPTGGTVGSVMNHFGFHVQSVAAAKAKWEAAGITTEAGNNPGQMFVTAPDGIRVEILEDAKIATPIAMHHIHLFVPDPLAAQDWYVKNFGAVAGKRGNFDTANIPGGEMTFTKNVMPQSPTKGRAVDHIGFEVKDIDQFVKTLEASGIHTEAAVRTSGNAPKLRLAYITDPWGTYIEITQGLTPAPAQSARR